MKISSTSAQIPGKETVDTRHLNFHDFSGRWSPTESGEKGARTAREFEGLEQDRIKGNVTARIDSVERRYETSDALSIYTREAAEVALLTPEEEVKLARRVRAGDEEARDHMIRANLRLVIKIARDYENLGLPLLDLINEGNLGLITAVERFDPDRGAKLSTYGAWWIKQKMRHALSNQGKTIRVPVNAMVQMHHLRKAALALKRDLDREPTDAELAEEVGLSVRRVTALRGSGACPASLDALLGDEYGRSLADVIPDENAADPAQSTGDKELIGRLIGFVGKLPDRESRIIKARFGLDDGNERTLEDLGEDFGVTRERIRQLQNIALNKLREMVEDSDEIVAAA